jgi:hypothetical protein
LPTVSRTIAITQSNYIPWRGYFDLIGSVDEFVLYDDAQYTHRDWRNRNLIKTEAGLRWMTIPVRSKGRLQQKISEALICDPDWGRNHWQTLVANYSRAAHFKTWRDEFEILYLDCRETHLSLVNRRFLQAVCRMLGIVTPMRWSSEFAFEGDRSERLLAICLQAGADTFLCGPRARDYLDVGLFARAGVRVCWMDYGRYPEYRQLHGEFQHEVSIVDLLFNEGPQAPDFMRCSRARTTTA